MVKRKSRRNSKNYRKTKRVSRKMRTNKRINRKSNKRINRKSNKRMKRRTNKRINGRSNKRMKRRTNQRINRKSNKRMKRRTTGKRTMYYKVGGSGDVLGNVQGESESLKGKIEEKETLKEFMEKEIKETIKSHTYSGDDTSEVIFWNNLISGDPLQNRGVAKKIDEDSVIGTFEMMLVEKDVALFHHVMGTYGTPATVSSSVDGGNWETFVDFYADFMLYLQRNLQEFSRNQREQIQEWHDMQQKHDKDMHVMWVSDDHEIQDSFLSEEGRNRKKEGKTVSLKRNMKGIVTEKINDSNVKVVFNAIQPYIEDPVGFECDIINIEIIKHNPVLEETSAGFVAAANDALRAEEERIKELEELEASHGAAAATAAAPPPSSKKKAPRRSGRSYNHLEVAREEKAARAARAAQVQAAQVQAAQVQAAQAEAAQVQAAQAARVGQAAAAGEDVQADAQDAEYYDEFRSKTPFEQQEEINRKEKELEDIRELYKKNRKRIKEESIGEKSEALQAEKKRLSDQKTQLKVVIELLKTNALTSLSEGQWHRHTIAALEFLGTFDVFKIQEMQSIVDMCFALTRYGRVDGGVTHEHKLHTRDIHEAQNEVDRILSAVRRLSVEMSKPNLTDFQKWKFLVDLERCIRNENDFRDNTCSKCNMKKTSENMRIEGHDKPVFKCRDVRCPVFWVIDFNAAGVSQYNKQNACELHTLHMNGVEKTRGGIIPNSYFSVDGFRDWVDTKKDINEKFPKDQEGIPKWTYNNSRGESICLDFHKNHMIRLFELKSSSDGDFDLFILLEAAYNKLITLLEIDRKGGIGGESEDWENAYRELSEKVGVLLGMKVSEIMGVSGRVDETLKDRLLREPDVPGTKYNLRDPSLLSLFNEIMLNVFYQEPESLWDDKTGLITTKGTSAEIIFSLDGTNIVAHSVTRPL